ncbi:PilX N-terminal domain-containing pilus assembly protein [uncultured Pseudomonas sp.]|uniref:PilX N-terminal domain-containing pilus assembly protein n=1 Tax=uncultured Pseudomonas sp. TaxID=114707 RepID=UPI00262C697A|nr:PilX N-terminal domain-containing pilus assembly protein [uncultured Pseudomonas sp.]
MNPRFPQQQRGVTLLVALVMLLVLTVLTVTNMREVTLETRMTANRMESLSLNNAAESALREGEARFFNALRLSTKPEPNKNYCKKSVKYNRVTMYPCIVEIEKQTDGTYAGKMRNYVLDPIATVNTHMSWTGAKTDTADNDTYIAWMPYRGTSSEKSAEATFPAYWNTAEMPVEGLNANYGDELIGRGVYYYLVSGQAKDELALQTTIAKYYPGPSN